MREELGQKSFFSVLFLIDPYERLSLPGKAPELARGVGHTWGAGFRSISGTHITDASGQPSHIKYNWKISNWFFSKNPRLQGQEYHAC